MQDSEQNIGDSFRVAMSRLAAGVVMVTCRVDGQPWGLTVSACCSVSMDPPLILASLGANTVSAAAITQHGIFGISVLGPQLVEVAQFGSSRGEPKFMQHLCANEHPQSDSPAVNGAVAHIDCLLEQRIVAGDHILFIGRVCNALLGDSDTPLVYHGRTYHQLVPSTDLGVRPVADETIDSLLYDYPLPRRFARVHPPN
ncbi:flavin reductase family protein [Capillimicrobium parvum]|nr:flavin reductase family protein [Capillimicrobium parvum]